MAKVVFFDYIPTGSDHHTSMSEKRSVPLLYSIDHYNGCITFEFNDRYHSVQKTIFKPF